MFYLIHVHVSLLTSKMSHSPAPMKLFKLYEVESLAITKWGSMKKLETEQEKEGNKIQTWRTEKKRKRDISGTAKRYSSH